MYINLHIQLDFKCRKISSYDSTAGRGGGELFDAYSSSLITAANSGLTVFGISIRPFLIVARPGARFPLSSSVN